MNLLHEFYEHETGKPAKMFINHGTIYTGEYIQWLEKMIMETEVRTLIEKRPLDTNECEQLRTTPPACNAAYPGTGPVVIGGTAGVA